MAYIFFDNVSCFEDLLSACLAPTASSSLFSRSNSEVGEELSGAIDVDSAGELEGPDRKSDDVDDGELLSSLYRPGKRRKAGESDLLSQQNGGEEGQSEAIVGPILYEPGELLPDLLPHIGSLLEVNVLAPHLSKENPHVKAGRIWGRQKYTADSDVVAMLHHSGAHLIKDTPPTDIFGVRVFFRIGEGLKDFKGTTEFGLTSQSWHSHVKESLTVERVLLMATPTPAVLRLQQLREQQATAGGDRSKTTDEARRLQLVNTSLFPTTLLMYSLSNDPCLGYDVSLLCDRGADPEEWTSYNFKFAVLYLETVSERFELSCEAEHGLSPFDLYRWGRVKEHKTISRDSLSHMTVPLETPHIEVVHSGLDWTKLIWSTDGVMIEGTLYPLLKMFWVPRSRALTPAAPSRKGR